MATLVNYYWFTTGFSDGFRFSFDFRFFARKDEIEFFGVVLEFAHVTFDFCYCAACHFSEVFFYTRAYYDDVEAFDHFDLHRFFCDDYVSNFTGDFVVCFRIDFAAFESAAARATVKRQFVRTVTDFFFVFVCSGARKRRT